MKPSYDKDLYFKASTFRFIPDIVEITEPLKKIGVTYFCYLEISQTIACLINQEEIAASYIENNGFVLDPFLASRELLPTGFYELTPYYQTKSEELLIFWQNIKPA